MGGPGVRTPLISIGPLLVSASIQNQSNTFPMTKVHVNCRRAVEILLKICEISALS